MRTTDATSMAIETKALINAVKLSPKATTSHDSLDSYLRGAGIECVERVCRRVLNSIEDLDNGKYTITGTVIGTSFTMMSDDRLAALQTLLREDVDDVDSEIISGIEVMLSRHGLLLPLEDLGYRVKIEPEVLWHGIQSDRVALVYVSL